MEEAMVPAAAHFALHIGCALDALPSHGLRGRARAFKLRLTGFDNIRRARLWPASRSRGQAANTLRPIRRPHIGRTVHRGAVDEIGRANVCTPVTNAHLVCRLL